MNEEHDKDGTCICDEHTKEEFLGLILQLCEQLEMIELRTGESSIKSFF